MKIRTIAIAVTAVLLFCTSCSSKADVLRIGIIRPSINHLPLTYALHLNPEAGRHLQIYPLSSGWEVQEALVSGKIDAAIMPFSYAWNAVAKGYPIKIASFLERETDAIVTEQSVQDISQLQGARIGLLKASTLDILWKNLADSLNMEYTALYFHSPNEQIAALQRSEVDAIVIYVPLIQKLDEQYHVLHWFAEFFPDHPCCDLVFNSDQLNVIKKKHFSRMLAIIDETIPSLDTQSALQYVKAYYRLSTEQAQDALRHTGFKTGLDDAGRDFEQRMMESALKMAYLESLPKCELVYPDAESH